MDHSSSKSFSFSSPLGIAGLLLFALGLIVGGIVGVLYHSGIDEVKSSLASVRGEVTRMRSETDGLDRKVNGFQATVDSGKKEMGEKLSAESQRIGQLASKVETLAGQQVTLKTDVKNMGTAQAAIKADVKNMGTAQAAMRTEVKTVVAAQAAIKEENKKFAGQLAAEIRRINSLDAKFQGVEKAAAATVAETKRLAADGTAIRADLKSLRSEFGSTDASFDKLVGALSGLGQ